MSNDQEVQKFGGTSRHLTWFDEAPRKDIWSECQMRHIDCNGSTILTMTPPTVGEGAGQDNWIFDEIYEQDGIRGIECFHFSIYDNPHNDESTIERIAGGLDEIEKDIRLYGKFRSLSGLVFKEFEVPIHVVDDFEIPKNWVRCCAFDPHPNAPFAGLYAAVDPYDFVYFYDEIYEEPLPIPEIANIIKAHEGNDTIFYRLIDPAADVENKIFGQISIKSQLQNCGINTISANNDFASGYYLIRDALKVRDYLDGTKRPSIYFFRSLTNTIYQITHYVWDRWNINASSKERKQMPRKKDDHLIDCLRYIMNSNPHFINLDLIKLQNRARLFGRKYRVIQ
jgi:hypothetical protein